MKHESSTIKDFVSAIVSADPTLKITQAKKAYTAVMEEFFNLLVKQQKSVRIPGIGTVSVTVRKETTYRNPRTKALIKKPSHKRLKFSISDTIKNALNTTK